MDDKIIECFERKLKLQNTWVKDVHNNGEYSIHNMKVTQVINLLKECIDESGKNTNNTKTTKSD